MKLKNRSFCGRFFLENTALSIVKGEVGYIWPILVVNINSLA
jgi:hypothetical protein